MKTLWKKKWVRRPVQACLLIVSLMALATVITNWWGARQRNRVVAELMREGHPVTLGTLLAPLPPDELNFAKIPFFTSPRGEEKEKRDAADSSVQAARQRLRAMNFMKGVSELKKRPREQDYQEWGRLLGCAGDARSCLERYDEVNAGALAALREGMSRPYAQSTWLHDIEKSGDWSLLNVWKGGLPLREVVMGLSLRAHAALAAGEPEVALESLVLGYRMAELIGSTALLPSVYKKVDACRLLKGALKGGLESGAWDDGQLASLDDILARIDLREDLRRANQVENACWLLTLDYLKQEPGQMAGWRTDSYLDGLSWGTRETICRMLPRGWFDLNATRELQHYRRRVDLLARPGLLAPWWRLGEELDAPIPRAVWEMPGSAYGTIFKDTCSGIVATQQARLACELERYRLVHHRYPESLEKIGGELILDPLNGQSFGYRLRDETYRLFSVGPDGTLTADSPLESRRGGMPWVW